MKEPRSSEFSGLLPSKIGKHRSKIEALRSKISDAWNPAEPVWGRLTSGCLYILSYFKHTPETIHYNQEFWRQLFCFFSIFFSRDSVVSKGIGGENTSRVPEPPPRSRNGPACREVASDVAPRRSLMRPPERSGWYPAWCSRWSSFPRHNLKSLSLREDQHPMIYRTREGSLFLL